MRNLTKKAYGQILIVTLLFMMLAGTTYALFLSITQVNDNIFFTGSVSIELNEGNPVFSDEDGIEPGMTLERPLTVKNTGTADVYYRLYLDGVSGTLADGLFFEIYDDQNLLYAGRGDEFSKANPCISGQVLPAGETHTLKIRARMDSSAGNEYQQTEMSFDIVGEAVQSRNNPDKSFPD